MINWNDILHHAFAGAVLALLFSTAKRTWLYFVIGVVAALLPDVTKVLFDDLLLHSLIVAPFVSVLCVGILKLYLKKEPFIRLFGAFFIAIVFGHILLDFLDDGNELFYPFIKKDLGYSIISKASPMVWIVAFVAIAVGFALKKIRLLAAVGVSVIILYFGFQLASKVMVTNALMEQYPIPNATVTVFPKGQWPWEASNWSYHIKSVSFLASGDSNATGNKIDQSIFYYTPEVKLQYRVEEWTEKDGYTLIKCRDEINNQIVYFESADGIHWSPVT